MMKNKIQIGSKIVGDQNPCFIIAEVAQAHDGSLGNAHAYIDAVAKTGVDAIKLQTHIADAESTIHEPWRVKFSLQDDSRFDYWKRMEFTEEQWKGLHSHASEKGLIFLSSPFSFEAVDMLDRVGVPAWKVPSGEITNLPLIEYMAKTSKPILLSSGMSTMNDLDAAIKIIEKHANPFMIFQCTTAYPCPPEKIGLNLIDEFKTRYGCPVGLSDHSGTIYASLAASALGVEVIEVHVVFSRDCFGPDTPASITIMELKNLVEGVDFINRAKNPVNKDQIAAAMVEMKHVFGKSIVYRNSLKKGHSLQISDVSFKKPGTGVSVTRVNEFVGRILRQPVRADEFLQEQDFINS